MSARVSRTVAALAIAITSLGASARPALAAWPMNPAVNVPFVTAGGNQTNSRACSDGSGGIVCAWEDRRIVSPRIYAQRITAAGMVSWGANGVLLSSAVSTLPAVLPVGDGSTWVAWAQQSEIRLARVLSTGAMGPGWPANGLVVSDGTFNATAMRPILVADGTGGVFVAWQDLGLFLNVARIQANSAPAAGWIAGGLNTFIAVNVPIAASDGAGGLFAAYLVFDGADMDINIVRLNGAGAVSAGWPAAGVRIADLAGDDVPFGITADGLGGAIVAWHQGVGIGGGGAANIYASRITGAGVVPASWAPTAGILVCGAAGAQSFPVIVADDMGGAYISWVETRLGAGGFPNCYVAHLSSAGFAVTGWPTGDGLAVNAAGTDGAAPSLAADGSGGVFVTYQDNTGPVFDVRLHRVLASGAVATGWPAAGRIACSAAGSQTVAQVIADGAGGALVWWQDYRDSATADLYAQRVDRFSRIGNPEPVIASVRDVPDDQGGRVKVSWDASYLDSDPLYEIDNYRVLRSVPPNVAASAMRAGAHLLTSAGESAVEGVRNFVTLPNMASGYYWELVTTQSALQVPNYSFDAPTANDAIGGSTPFTAFMVQARNAAGTQFWFSAPDSGYSVDDLAPATPAAFTAQFPLGPSPQAGAASATSGTTRLHWRPNAEADFREYRLYKGGNSDFPISPATFLVAKADTGYADLAGGPYWYKLVAADVHGNVSGVALVSPAMATGVPVDGASALALGPVWPNPASDGADVRLTLSRDADITLAVYDAAGRRVREIARGRMPAGEHALHWDLRDQAGHHASSSIYFLRLESDGLRLRRAFAVAR